FFSSRRRHTISKRDWSSDVCSSDLICAIGSLLLEKEIQIAGHDQMRSQCHRKGGVAAMDQISLQNTKRQPALHVRPLVNRGAYCAGANLFDERGKQVGSDDGQTVQ